MAASTARHETRALLRAHLAAVSGYRHFTRHCPVCHRLLRLAMDATDATDGPHATEAVAPAEPDGTTAEDDTSTRPPAV
ncbi:DUF6274 family protein [Streptomyces sp. NPDC002133]|uniref:DUF6274 family protein n=1 Tax=Streptomyces sp. NPDC002133 TaxID=3154409 RepID=UPI003328BA85